MNFSLLFNFLILKKVSLEGIPGSISEMVILFTSNLQFQIRKWL